MTLASEAFDKWRKHQHKVTSVPPDISFWVWVQTFDTEYWKELVIKERDEKSKIMRWRK